MRLSAQQCVGLDELLLEAGMQPSKVLDGNGEVINDDEFDQRHSNSRAAIELAAVNPRGGSFNHRMQFPHEINRFTGCGRRVPVVNIDGSDEVVH